MGCVLLQDLTVRWMVKCHSEDKYINHVPLLSIEYWSALLLRAASKHLLLSPGCVCQALIRSVFLGYFRSYTIRGVSGDLSPRALHLLPVQGNQIPFCAYFAHHNHKINISLHFALSKKQQKIFKDFDRLPLGSISPGHICANQPPWVFLGILEKRLEIRIGEKGHMVMHKIRRWRMFCVLCKHPEELILLWYLWLSGQHELFIHSQNYSF